MSKNLVVFSDGTGQEGGSGSNTNVYKLFNMIEDRTEKQVSFYDRGIGTGWRKITGNIGGMGISRNIKECYEFIFNTYNAGDNIYLFGFSRGATTVRSLSAFIHLFGILPKSRPELIKRAYKIYKISNGKKRKERADDFVNRHHNQWCKIKFLGVWDTVSALGSPHESLNYLLDKIPFFKHKFHNLSLSESVEHARHALAIDDERLIFHPKIWENEIKDYQTMKQTWFCGMHTDVGGGYEEHNLSDIPMIWMTKEAKEHGLRLYPKHNVKLIPDPSGFMHNSREKLFAKIIYRKRIRSWDAKLHGKPVVHESVLLRKKNKNNADDPPYIPWILNQDYDVEDWQIYLRDGKYFIRGGGGVKEHSYVDYTFGM